MLVERWWEIVMGDILSPALSEGEGDVSGEVLGDLFFSVFGKDCFVPRNDGVMWFLSPALSEGEGYVSGEVVGDCGGGL